MKKPMKRLFCMLLAALMTVSIIAVAPGGAETAEAATLSELQDQAAASKARLAELKKQLSELQSSKADALAQKNVLDEQNNLLQSQIDNASAQITALESELAENQKKEEAQYELFCEQVRSEEERGTLSYWSVLFKALKGAFTSSPVAKLGALAVKGSLSGLKSTLSAETYGGAPLLGVKGACIVGHGSSSPTAVKNGIHTAAKVVRGKVPELIAQAVAR